MATATHLPVKTLTMEEYLNTSYKPDCDFVDGHLERRNVGTTPHSRLIAVLINWFMQHETDWRLYIVADVRTIVSRTRVRLPDVAVLSDEVDAEERAQTQPPFIAIEVLSPKDRLPRVLIRLADFHKMGVQHIWLLDPERRTAAIFDGISLQPVNGTTIEIEGSSVYLDLAHVFSKLR